MLYVFPSGTTDAVSTTDRTKVKQICCKSYYYTAPRFEPGTPSNILDVGTLKCKRFPLKITPICSILQFVVVKSRLQRTSFVVNIGNEGICQSQKEKKNSKFVS